MDQEGKEESLRGFARPLDRDKWKGLDHQGCLLFRLGRSFPVTDPVDVSNAEEEEEEESPEWVLLGRPDWSTGLARIVSDCWARWSSKVVAGAAAVAAGEAAATADEAAAAAASRCAFAGSLARVDAS